MASWVRSVVGICLVALVAACGDGGGDATTGLGPPAGSDGGVAVPSFEPVASEPVDGATFLLPGPDGPAAEVRVGTVDDTPPPADDDARLVVLGVPTDDGARDVVRVGVGGLDPYPFEGNDQSNAVEIGGRSGWLVEHELGTDVSLTDEDRMILVLGGPDTTEVVLEVAESVDPEATDAASILTGVPAGLTVLAEQTLTTGLSFPSGVDGWSLVLQVGDGAVNVLGTVTGGEAMSPWFLAGTGGGPLRTVAVRGTTGLLAEQSLALDGELGSPDDLPVTIRRLVWVESPTTTVTLTGSADPETLVAVADALRVVDRAEFEAQVPSIGDGSLPTPTLVEDGG